MEEHSESQVPGRFGLGMMRYPLKKKKKASSRNVLNIRIDLDSRKFDGPLRDKIRGLVREEVLRTFNIICSHCNRKFNDGVRSQPSLFLAGSPELTVREKEVMELVIQKKTDRQISRILGITLNTVRNHMKSIKTKLGVHSRSDARDEYMGIKESER